MPVDISWMREAANMPQMPSYAEQQQARNALALQGMQLQEGKMKLEDAMRARQGLAQITEHFKNLGIGDDPEAVINIAIQNAPNMGQMDKIPDLLKARAEIRKAKQADALFATAGGAAAPAAPAPQSNMMAPATAPAAPANAMAAGPSLEQTRDLGMKLVQLGDPRGQQILQNLDRMFPQSKMEGQPEIVRVQARIAQLPLGSPERTQLEQYLNKLTAAPSSSVVNVNTQLPASEAAQTEFMKGTRATYDQLKTVPATLKNLEEAKRLIPAAKTFMGTGGDAFLKAATFLNNRLGTSIDVKGITDATELRSRLFYGIMDNLRKVDAQPTQQQQNILQEALGSLNTDPNALPNVLDAYADSLRQRVDLYNEEVAGAEERGVKFPYNPKIKLPPVVGAAPAFPNAPPIGTIAKGHKYIGGDPADPKSWERQ